MRNTWIIGTIVGQAVVTLVSIAYGVSAHSSWEAERQRRVAGERAAVAEMATAMKGAGDRIVTVEQELRRCQVRLRRANRPRTSSSVGPALTPVEALAPVEAPAPAASPPTTSLYPGKGFRLVSGPLIWTAEAGSPWCEGRYESARGTNFAPCPGPVR